MTTISLTYTQYNALTNFVTKHQINEIHLNKAEARYFFDTIPADVDLLRARILLQPVFAEGYIRKDNNYESYTGVIIISQKQLLKTDNILWEDGYDDPSHTGEHYNPFTRKFFMVFSKKMGVDHLLDKIADRLSQIYPLSKGQAKAVLIKYLGFPQDSGTRSFLHDLRKKIRKYQILIAEFQEYVFENEQPKLIPLEYMNELLQIMDDEEINMVRDKILPKWIENQTESDKPVELNSILASRKRQLQSIDTTEKMKKLEKRFPLQMQPKYEFKCQECGYTREIIEKSSEDEFVDSPLHHDKPMIVRIITRND